MPTLIRKKSTLRYFQAAAILPILAINYLFLIPGHFSDLASNAVIVRILMFTIDSVIVLNFFRRLRNSNRDRAHAEKAVIANQFDEQTQARTKELSQAIRFLDSLIENIPNMIFVKDAESLSFVRFNRAGEKLLGMSKAELIGKNDYDFFPQVQADQFVAYDRQVLEGKDVVDIPEEQISTKYGLRYLHTRKIPLLDEYGHAQYLLGISEDITEKKQLLDEKVELVRRQTIQTETLAQADRYRLLAEAGKVLSESLNYQTTLVNFANIVVPRLADWCTISVFENGELQQLAVAHRDPEKVKWAWTLNKKFPTRPGSEAGHARVARTGQGEMIAEIPIEMVRAAAINSEHLEVLNSVGLKSYIAVPIRARGQVLGVLSIFTTDESGRIYNENDLSIAQELADRAGFSVDNSRLYREAQNVNQVKDEFLATLSHELRTPLNVIQGHAEILKSEAPDLGELNSSVDAIYRNANLQTQIIKDILDVSAIITGKISFHPQEIEPVESIQSAVDGLRFSAEAKGVRITEHYPKEKFHIRTDPLRLNQIVWNLISNAIKFTSRGGNVEISIEARENEFLIEVKDDGRGIDQAFLPYVFDRFRQEDSTVTRKFGGLGLGLSIVRHLTELHGGEVRVKSEGKGKGSTFTVSLPLKRSQYLNPSRADDPQNVSPPAYEAPAGRLDGVRILVVDDEADNRSLVKRFLEKAGARVTVADSAAQGLNLLSDEEFDLIASDISMPEMDGFEFIKVWRQREAQLNRRQIPAAALTAYARDEEKQKALDSGYQMHISKPVTAKTLVDALQACLKVSKVLSS